MDEDRIVRIARAMCRAARLDPDKPAEQEPSDMISLPPTPHEAPQPTWMLFRQQAARFAAQHRDIAATL